MIHDEFSFSYTPVNPGTSTTNVVFYTKDKTCTENNDSIDISQVISDTIQNTSSEKKLFVTDTNVEKQQFFAKLSQIIKETPNFSLLVLPAGEKHKTIENVLKIVKAALEFDMQRSSTFIGIGGGVITDMTSFATSIFKRGAKLELVPTTLLAMVDAALGGKTGCDFSEYKNMIGTFYPASIIHIFPDCLKTLNEIEYRSGLGEVFKTALLYAPKLFQILQTQSAAVLKRDDEFLTQMIKRCVQAKAHIVERDLQEKNIRMQLNFGHTFAHALETVAGLGTIPHGDAVAWGICRAITLSHNMGFCSKEYVDEVFEVAQLYGWETNPLPCILSDGETQDSIIAIRKSILDAMKKDKKNNENSIRFILQREINSTFLQEISQDDILLVL